MKNNMEKLLICIDSNDAVIGFGKKLDVHTSGQLHRAFSMFIIDLNKKQMLLQKRSLNKYHSGGLWSNSCCSHPYKDETWANALKRCAMDELNIQLNVKENINCCMDMPPQFIDRNLYFAGTFKYYSNYKDLSEHELDYVFIYYIEKISDEIEYNSREVCEINWISKYELEKKILDTPEAFTSWFLTAYKLVKAQLD